MLRSPAPAAASMTSFQRDALGMLTLFHHPFCPHSRFVRLVA